MLTSVALFCQVNFMRNTVYLVVLLVMLVLLSCLPSTGTVNSIVGVWTEEEVTSETGIITQPEHPLIIGFFADNTFKAVYSNHRFETYHDFWGNWSTQGRTLELKITGGNQLPPQPSYTPEYELQNKLLILKGLSPAGDTSITKITYKYSGAPPPDGILP
jgi:hypothetical protein